jgi:2-keto-3-deoxy-L-rhamnonate aldolase RhmA
MQFQDYLRRANSETSVIILVEHMDAVKNIESIVRVAGIDAVFVGPYDLSASLGKPGEVNDPAVHSCIERVRRAVSDAGIHIGIFGMTPDALEGLTAHGFTLLTVGVDTVFLGIAAKTAFDRLKRIPAVLAGG